MTIGIGSIVILRSECLLPAGEATYMTVEKAHSKFENYKTIVTGVDAVWLDANHRMRRAYVPVRAVIEITPVNQAPETQSLGVLH